MERNAAAPAETFGIDCIIGTLGMFRQSIENNASPNNLKCITETLGIHSRKMRL